MKEEPQKPAKKKTMQHTRTTGSDSLYLSPTVLFPFLDFIASTNVHNEFYQEKNTQIHFLTSVETLDFRLKPLSCEKSHLLLAPGKIAMETITTAFE